MFEAIGTFYLCLGGSIGIAILGAVGSFLFYQLFVRTIPYKTVCITTRFGKIYRVLEPGIYILHFFEFRKHVEWEWYEEGPNGKPSRKSIEGFEIPTSPIQIDPLPVEVSSKDRTLLIVNPIINMRITNPKKFMESSYTDPFSRILSEVSTTIISVSRTLSGQVLMDDFNQLVRPCTDLLNQIGDEMGFSLVSFSIQSITLPKERAKLEQDIETNRRKNEAQAFEAQTAHATAMTAQTNSTLFAQKKLQDAHAMNMNEQQRIQDIEVAKMETEAKVADLRRKEKILKEEHDAKVAALHAASAQLPERELISAWGDAATALRVKEMETRYKIAQAYSQSKLTTITSDISAVLGFGDRKKTVNNDEIV
jgi:regulator of protease activity HflC (stomatin/prohibitin superfamily)